MIQKKILVTGGTGYIGSHTVVELIKNGYEPVIIDNLFNSKIDVLDKIEKICGIRPDFFQVDLCDKEKLREVFSNNDFSLCVHFAGLKAVEESIREPLRYYQNNIGGTINLLECMDEFGVKNIIFSSSATVYGTQRETCLVETMKTGEGITNPYGRTKYIIEEILKDVVDSDKDFSATILRYFNPIGAHESGLLGEDPNDIPNNLMPIVTKVYTGEIPELKIFGDDYETKDGSCVRDFIHVEDLAKGHLSAMKKMGGLRTYNLGTGRGTSVFEIVDAFEKISGKTLKKIIVPRREGDLPEIFANPGKAREELGWSTEKTIEDAIKDTLNYLEVNKMC